MYFTLTVNEQLANAMRAAAELKVEVEKIIECVCTDENSSIYEDKEDYEKMSGDICDMMVAIGRSIGLVLTDIALDEVRKLNQNTNRINIESHVSE